MRINFSHQMLVFALVVAAIALAPCARSDTHYVNKANPAPANPFTSWASAATNIQDALDWAVDGDKVLVTNGVYNTGGRLYGGMTNRVVISNAVTLIALSANPADTLIVGASNNGTNGPAAVRCVYMNSGVNSRLIGFTMTNGHTLTGAETATYGATMCAGGIYQSWGGYPASSYASNCIVIGCSGDGNDHYTGGGGVAHGNYYNCTITRNSVRTKGGGGGGGGVFSNCVISYNSAPSGGGLSMHGYGEILTMYNCSIVGNSAGGEGGGINGNFQAYDCLIASNYAGWLGGAASLGGSCPLVNCEIRGNSAADVNSGGCFYGSPYLTNCLIYNNRGVFYNAVYAMNCTIVSNAGRTLYQGGSLTNCIIYNNFRDLAPVGWNWTYQMSSCCVPTGGVDNATIIGDHNITNNPLFVDSTNGDYRLQNISPCINNGRNADWMYGAVELSGLRRIIDGTVDMGAYEFLPCGTIITIFGASAP